MHSGEKHTPVCMIHCHSCAQALLIVNLNFGLLRLTIPQLVKSLMLESPAPRCSLPLPVLWSLGDSDMLKGSSDYMSGNTKHRL